MLNQYDVRTQPFYFLYGGHLDAGFLHNVGNWAIYRSSAGFSIDYAYYLYFNSANVFPSSRNNHYNGYSIRCLAR